MIYPVFKTGFWKVDTPVAFSFLGQPLHEKSELSDKRLYSPTVSPHNLQDFSDPTKLLEKQNVDLDQLIQYTLDIVHYATKYNLPTDIKLVQNPNGTPDIAVFDFTSLKKSASASKMMERKGKRLLMALVGDSLLQVCTTIVFSN